MNTAKKTSLHTLTRILSAIAGLAMFSTIFLPMWKIELSAPQYPEGLEMYIYSDHIGGQVDIINGLNHYIGMRTIHEDDFAEFQVLPYVLGLLAIFGLLTAIINRKWFFYLWCAFFVAFVAVLGVDFYFWLYNYGHNLDPTAPIQVPGMTYQPPLIGFKQLLNFGAYSIPASGGWVMAVVGATLAFLVGYEIKSKKTI